MKNLRAALYFWIGFAIIALGWPLFYGCAHRPFENWSQADTARELTWTALHAVDWGQTLDISDHPERFYEINPCLGEHPSRGKVNRYFALGTIAHPLISGALSPKYRVWWQYVSIGISGGVVIHNHFHAGIRMGW